MHPLQDLIYKNGFTLSGFCESIGVNRGTLYNLFQGRTHQLRRDTCYKISDKLRVPVEVIIAISTEGL